MRSRKTGCSGHREVPEPMFLKRIKVSGFKSFADPIDLDFGPGVTCIVGPNGCGKSNVLDAVNPGWKERYFEEGVWLDDLFAEVMDPDSLAAR